MLPIVVLFDRDDVQFLSELITNERERIAVDTDNPPTEEELEFVTDRLYKLVSLLKAVNEGARNAVETMREMNKEVQ